MFAGRRRRPYLESDPVGPLSVYGASKVDAERAALRLHPGSLVIRASAFFGPWDESNFAQVALRELDAGRTFAAADDLVVSPTYVPDLVHAVLDLLVDDEQGIWHVANAGEVTWAEFARLVAAAAGVDDATLEARPSAELGLAALRPGYSVLGSERGWLLEPLEDAVARFVAERASSGSSFAQTSSGEILVAD